MAGEVLDAYADKVSVLSLEPAGNGIFQVRIGEEVAYDKQTTGRFPKPGEARDLMAARL